MKTTRYQAEKFYKIGNYIDPFASCSFDKKEEIDNIMANTYEENLNYLKEYILERYETASDILNDTELMRQYSNLVKGLN